MPWCAIVLRTCYPIAESLNLPPRFHQDLHEVAGLHCFSLYIDLVDLQHVTPVQQDFGLHHDHIMIISWSYHEYHDLPWLSNRWHMVLQRCTNPTHLAWLQEGGVFEGPRRGIRRESYPLPSSQQVHGSGTSHGKWMNNGWTMTWNDMNRITNKAN